MVATSTRPKTKVAVACQGGGSQTAFTAGALKRILRDPGLDRDYELVALSGTSGGALCCLLAWYGLLAPTRDLEHRGDRAAELLTTFWQENSAHDPWDLLLTNPLNVAIHRMVDRGLLPAAPLPPAVPRMVRERLQKLLERFVPFEQLPGLLDKNPHHPTLLCGAVNVNSGEFAVFEEACPDPEWRRRAPNTVPPTVSVDTVLASAAVPPLMPAVRVGTADYWDGLFAHNPPIRRLVECDLKVRPDEIWVIQIDPDTTTKVPTTPLGTVDRRFELSSNLSLNAELHWVRQINQWVDEEILPGSGFKVIEMPHIRMSTDLSDGLDLATKIDRNPTYLRKLMDDGEAQAAAFLQTRASRDNATWWPRTFPGAYQPSTPRNLNRMIDRTQQRGREFAASTG